MDLCHHHLQICVGVVSARGKRQIFTGGFILQLNPRSISSMHGTRVPFQSLSETDDGELTSRRMRLFPHCGWLTNVLPCLCFVVMVFPTVFWLKAFSYSLANPAGSKWVTWGADMSYVEQIIMGVTFMVCTLYACLSRTQYRLYPYRCLGVTPIGVLVTNCYFWDMIYLANECEETDQQACEKGDVKACQFVSSCEALAPLSKVAWFLVVLSWFVLVGFHLRDQVDSRRQRVELKAAKIRWVKVNSFKKWNEQGICIPRFQDLEEHDYVEGCEAWSFTAWLLGTRYVVSHAWITSEHPDPDCVQLQALLRELTKCNRWKFWKLFTGSYDVVFFDFASLPQDGPRGAKRNDEENRLFRKALAGMNLLYSDQAFSVLIILDTPTPQSGDGAECRPYEKRGWCYTELAISTARGTVVNHLSSDVRQLIKQEKMPVLPEEFRENFEVKEFTKNGDRATVLKIYSKFFQRVETQVTWPKRVIYVGLVAGFCALPYTSLLLQLIRDDQ